MRSHPRVEFCCLLLLSILIVGCRKSTATPQPKAHFRIYSGDEWRSWSPEQRAGYVQGYLDGHVFGIGQTCEAADWQSFDIPGGAKLTPEMLQICQQKIHNYSRGTSVDQVMRGAAIDITPYTGVLDAFYEHPECRVMPFPIILNHLDDEEYMTGEELFRYLQGGPNPGGRGRSWGFFTGFDGMDKCYSTHLNSSPQ